MSIVRATQYYHVAQSCCSDKPFLVRTKQGNSTLRNFVLLRPIITKLGVITRTSVTPTDIPILVKFGWVGIPRE